MCSSSGTISAVAGTACGTLNWSRASSGLPPVKPNIPAGSVLLGEVYVPGNATSLTSANIIDKTALWIPNPGTLLQSHRYAPVSQTAVSLAVSLAALDTTNDTIAFTVPANGIVDVDVEAFYVANAVSGATPVIGWGLLNHTGGAQLGETANMSYTATNGSWGGLQKHRFHLTGLTPGPLQLDFAAGISTVVNASGSIFALLRTSIPATSAGAPILMQAFASV